MPVLSRNITSSLVTSPSVPMVYAGSIDQVAALEHFLP